MDTDPFVLYNTMATDDLAMQGAKASAAIVLMQFLQNILSNLLYLDSQKFVTKASVIWTKMA